MALCNGKSLWFSTCTYLLIKGQGLRNTDKFIVCFGVFISLPVIWSCDWSQFGVSFTIICTDTGSCLTIEHEVLLHLHCILRRWGGRGSVQFIMSALSCFISLCHGDWWWVYIEVKGKVVALCGDLLRSALYCSSELRWCYQCVTKAVTKHIIIFNTVIQWFLFTSIYTARYRYPYPIMIYKINSIKLPAQCYVFIKAETSSVNEDKWTTMTI